ncbi:MAG: hypothetical protein QG641_56 [Candidatus Poribacteria bacterium]|nr:hypothetical protein [Candidatus Poribacteria bacterium]
MKTLEISLDFATEIPYEIDKEEIQETLKKQIVLHFFKEGKISSGKAAEMLGITKSEMLDIIYSEGIPYYDYNDKDIKLEFEASKKLGNEAK